MEWSQLRLELGIALNESDLLGFEVDANRRVAAATFRVLTLPKSGPAPEDRRVQMLFSPIGRVAASLRHGRWDDASAPVERFELSQLLDVVQRFGGQPIYGWEFFDQPENKLAKWGNRLSLDWRGGSDGLSRSITVFQESFGPEQAILDLCVWFDELQVRRPDGETVPLEEFAAAGRRWWDGLHAGDSRTQSHGIVPGGPVGGNT